MATSENFGSASFAEAAEFSPQAAQIDWNCPNQPQCVYDQAASLAQPPCQPFPACVPEWVKANAPPSWTPPAEKKESSTNWWVVAGAVIAAIGVGVAISRSK